MSAVHPLEQNNDSKDSHQSCLTLSFNLQKSQIKDLKAENEVSPSEQLRLSSEQQSEKKYLQIFLPHNNFQNILKIILI